MAGKEQHSLDKGEPKVSKQAPSQEAKKRDIWFHPGALKVLSDTRKTPEEIQDAFTHGLRVARKGAYPKHAKPWKGEGAGVYELREDDPGGSGTYRAVYVTRFAEAVYVLHVWHKKSSTGSKTADEDIELVKRRLKWAKADYEKRYKQGKADSSGERGGA